MSALEPGVQLTSSTAAAMERLETSSTPRSTMNNIETVRLSSWLDLCARVEALEATQHSPLLSAYFDIVDNLCARVEALEDAQRPRVFTAAEVAPIVVPAKAVTDPIWTDTPAAPRLTGGAGGGKDRATRRVGKLRPRRNPRGSGVAAGSSRVGGINAGRHRSPARTGGIPMTPPLSSAAAAVLRAAGDSEPGIYATIAAALEAAADQVVPEPDDWDKDNFSIRALRLRCVMRDQLLAIAAELETFTTEN